VKLFRFACLFAILISLLVLAQSKRALLANQPNGLHIAQEPQHAMPPNRFQMPQGTAFLTAWGRSKATAPRRGTSPASGLDFAPAVSYSSGGHSPSAVAIADVNGDGKPDLLVANQYVDSTGQGNGTVGVLLGNGDGTFQTAVTYGAGGYEPSSVAVADVNGDGNPDLIVANYCAMQDGCRSPNVDGSVGVLLGNGDGTFQTVVTYDSGALYATSVAIADVNGDGKPDLVVANEACNNQCSGSPVDVLLGNGDGTFQPAVTYGSGGVNANSVAIADVNGDNKPDLIVANYGGGCGLSGNVGVLLGNGDGTFQTAVTYGSGSCEAYSVAVADVNGDNKPDLLVSNYGASYTVGVLLGNGDGTFQTAVTYGSGGHDPTGVAVADVNGDGNPDLIVANYGSNTVGVLLGNGDGTFQTAITYGSGGDFALSVAVKNVNGDGKPDIAVVSQCGGSTCDDDNVGVLINTSTGFTTTALVSSQNPSNFGQLVTFTATLTASQFFKFQPTGTVSFFDGSTSIGNSNLNGSGVATLTTANLAVGTHSMTATYNGDANFGPSTSPILYQVVQGAIAMLSPSGLNFGNQTVGIPSTPQNVTLQNTGNINLAISLIETTGPNAGDFPETNNCPGSLAPNGRCTIKVTFKPSAVGTRNAALSVTDNAPGSPQSASLTGTGVLPAVTLSPTSLTFATQTVYTTSPAQKVTLTNTGLGILKITAGKVSNQFGGSTNCGATIAPGASCTIDVTFKPIMKGTVNGDVSVTDNAPGSLQKVPLTGTGTYVQLSPTSVGFGNQPINTTSNPRYITFTNKGSATVNFTGAGITITGTDEGDFAETNNCGTSVVSGASCKIKVTFTPSAEGQRTAEVSISDDGGGSPQTVPLTGTGTP
jgi:hypothetical protein